MHANDSMMVRIVSAHASIGERIANESFLKVSYEIGLVVDHVTTFIEGQLCGPQ